MTANATKMSLSNGTSQAIIRVGNVATNWRGVPLLLAWKEWFSYKGKECKI